MKPLLVGLCLLSIPLTACQAEPTTEHYLTPIVTGQVLDKDNNQPLGNVSIIFNSDAFTKTNKDGVFRLPATAFNSSPSTGSSQRNRLAESSMSVSKENYRRKSYWNYGLPRINIQRNFEVPGYVHIGKIYLERLPTGASTNDVEDDFIENMTFCQPNESQKEVNCVPMPDGVNREDL